MPTENYHLFSLAERLGRTVVELLTGEPRPLSALEHYLWMRYGVAQARIRQQNRKA